MGLNLLMVDDDQKLNGLLVEYFAQFGHMLVCATTAHEGLRKMRQSLPELLILDVMLPDMDGLRLCQAVRQEFEVPIIMLTARGDLPDRVLGLELGADDYVAKPFEPRELVARIESVSRRYRRPVTGQIHSGGLTVDPHTRSVTKNELPIELSSAEFDLLMILITSRQRAFSREQLLIKLKGLHAESFERSLDMLVSRLRQKLGDDPKSPEFIKTIWGTGYQFIGPQHE